MVKSVKGWGGTGIFLGGCHGRKEFPEEGPLELALGRALGGAEVVRGFQPVQRQGGLEVH